VGNRQQRGAGHGQHGWQEVFSWNVVAEQHQSGNAGQAHDGRHCEHEETGKLNEAACAFQIAGDDVSGQETVGGFVEATTAELANGRGQNPGKGEYTEVLRADLVGNHDLQQESGSDAPQAHGIDAQGGQRYLAVTQPATDQIDTSGQQSGNRHMVCMRITHSVLPVPCIAGGAVFRTGTGRCTIVVLQSCVCITCAISTGFSGRTGCQQRKTPGRPRRGSFQDLRTSQVRTSNHVGQIRRRRFRAARNPGPRRFR
jgi:hypothetical protein